MSNVVENSIVKVYFQIIVGLFPKIYELFFNPIRNVFQRYMFEVQIIYLWKTQLVRIQIVGPASESCFIFSVNVLPEKIFHPSLTTTPSEKRYHSPLSGQDARPL